MKDWLDTVYGWLVTDCPRDAFALHSALALRVLSFHDSVDTPEVMRR